MKSSTTGQALIRTIKKLLKGCWLEQLCCDVWKILLFTCMHAVKYSAKGYVSSISGDMLVSGVMS